MSQIGGWARKLFPPPSPLLSLPTLPMGPLHSSCTSWFTEGKVWCCVVGKEKCAHCYLPSLLHNQLPLSPGLLSSTSLSCPCCGLARRSWHQLRGPTVHGGCRCYAWCCSVLWRPKPWERGALRNVGKYSFRLTPFLPLSGSAATPTPLHNLGYTTAEAWGQRTSCLTVTGLKSVLQLRAGEWTK